MEIILHYCVELLKIQEFYRISTIDQCDRYMNEQCGRQGERKAPLESDRQKELIRLEFGVSLERCDRGYAVVHLKWLFPVPFDEFRYPNLNAEQLTGSHCKIGYRNTPDLVNLNYIHSQSRS